jgi:hypothetical protein
MTPQDREQLEYLWRETHREMMWAAAQGDIRSADRWLALLTEQREMLGYRPETEE